MKYDLVITTAFGVESVAKNELRKLGFSDPKAIEGSFFVQGTDIDVARANLFLRTAERVYIKVGSFRAETFDDLFDGTKSLPWENYLAPDGNFIVNGKSKKSALFSLSACQSVIKKAVLTRLAEKRRVRVFDESGARYGIVFSIADNEATILLDTSGVGLHKRGYRDLVAPAQMKETLASAVVTLSGMTGEKPFVDPFCGCGTFVIEAALSAMNIAPGINRDFDFLHWRFYEKKQFDLACEEAKDGENRNIDLHFCGYDVDPDVIKLAFRHAKNAGVENKVHFQVRDVCDLSSRFSEGVLCCDPPYGKRLLDLTEARRLTTVLGERYALLGDKWTASVISAVPDFERRFGKKADKNRKFFNANELCRLYTYLPQKI